VSIRGRFILAIAGALAFGLVAGLVHGNDGGLRGALGNLSAPWLFVALIPGWFSGSALRGAAFGTMATLVALVGFYITLTATMYGHLGAIHGFVASFTFVLRANQVWFAAGLFSGPVCGTLAGFLGSRLATTWLAVGLGALMVGEIAVVTGVQGLEVPILHMRWGGASDLRGYHVEAMLGLLVLGWLAARRRQRTEPPGANRSSA
jgi:MYXO-CTERM domain-containing protein